MYKLYDTILSMTQATNSVSTNPTLNAFDKDYCKELESKATTDSFIKSRVKKAVKELQSAKTIDYNDHYKSAFDAYNEAVCYLLIKNRGFTIEGIHETSSSTPDVKVEFSYKDGYGRKRIATIYIEVKSLAYSDGNLEYNRVQAAARDSKIDMEEQRRLGRSICSSMYEVSPLGGNSYGPSAEIEAINRKIENNIKRDQYTYGNGKDTILLVDLSQYEFPLHMEECLPIYPDIHRCQSASGKLWMLAFGKKNERIFKFPEFAGKGNFDKDLIARGILNRYKYIKGIIFTSGSRAADKTIFGFYRHKEINLKTTFFIRQFCDFANDDLNSFGYRYYETLKKKMHMDIFLSDSVTSCPVSMLAGDSDANGESFLRTS